MWPTISNLFALCFGTFIVTACWSFLLRAYLKRWRSAYIVAALLSIAIIAFIPEPDAIMYRDDIDSQVGFSMMKLCAFLTLLFTTLLGNFVGSWWFAKPE